MSPGGPWKHEPINSSMPSGKLFKCSDVSPFRGNGLDLIHGFQTNRLRPSKDWKQTWRKNTAPLASRPADKENAPYMPSLGYDDVRNDRLDPALCVHCAIDYHAMLTHILSYMALPTTLLVTGRCTFHTPVAWSSAHLLDFGAGVDDRWILFPPRGASQRPKHRRQAKAKTSRAQASLPETQHFLTGY
jgi:hypothetical protein